MKMNPFRRASRNLIGSPVPLSPADVVWAYRIFLGREPESNDVVQERCGTNTDIKSLVAEFMASEEYLRRRSALDPKDVEWAYQSLLGRKPESAVIAELCRLSHADLKSLVEQLVATPEFVEHRILAGEYRGPRAQVELGVSEQHVRAHAKRGLRWPVPFVEAIWGSQAPKFTLLRPLPEAPRGFPDGWASHVELNFLYNLALNCPGPILEIGPWIGRSTTALCLGLRDRELPLVSFDTVDYGHTGVDEFTRAFGALPDGEDAAARIVRQVEQRGGSIAVLISGLRDNGLLDFVTQVIRGDFLLMPIHRSYSLVFCDTTHDEGEARRYVPKIAGLLNGGAVLVFDDVMDEAFAKVICSYLPKCRHLLLQQHDKYSKYLVVKLDE